MSRGIVKGAQHVGQRIYSAQGGKECSLLERFLANRGHISVFHHGMRQLLGVVLRSQAIQAVIRNFGDAQMRFARIGVPAA